MSLRDFLHGVFGREDRFYSARQIPQTSWAIEFIQGMDASQIWRSQPSVRTVVGFTARNVARLGLHTFERIGEDRKRTYTDPVAMLLEQPNPDTTTFELIRSLVSDLALNDEGYLFLCPDSQRPSGWSLRNIPVSWVTPWESSTWEVTVYRVAVPGVAKPQFIPGEFILHFHGWNPLDARVGASPLDALRDTMAEQISAAKYRKNIWDTNARAGSVITRPAATPWSKEAKERFMDYLESAFGKEGAHAGGTMVLEDGMTYARVRFSAQEEQFVEAAKLSLETVAQVYYINPTMIGVLDNANYSNMKEFRKALYGETLGAPIEDLEQRLNGFLVPRVKRAPDVFVEFNVKQQLQGSFEEQAAVISTSTGGPWLTRNEARAIDNRPPIDGGDELIVPLNVVIGGQASPSDTQPPGQASALSLQALRSIVQLELEASKTGAPETKALTRSTKARASQDDREKMAGVLSRFAARQADAVSHALGAKADGWWDEERWNGELSADLAGYVAPLSTRAGRATLAGLALDPGLYDPSLTQNYLDALAANTASSINAVTKAQLDEALASEEGMDAVGGVFEKAQGARADEAGAAIVTGVVGFAAVESLRHAGLDQVATKTWDVTSRNPRPSHASMAGETVALSENFSNGAAWPGDANLGVDEIAGCQCGLSMNIP